MTVYASRIFCDCCVEGAVSVLLVWIMVVVVVVIAVLYWL